MLRQFSPDLCYKNVPVRHAEFDKTMGGFEHKETITVSKHTTVVQDAEMKGEKRGVMPADRQAGRASSKKNECKGENEREE